MLILPQSVVYGIGRSMLMPAEGSVSAYISI